MAEPFDFPKELRADAVMLEKSHPYTADMLNRAAKETDRLRGTLRYIAAQAKAQHAGALQVILANAESALAGGPPAQIRAAINIQERTNG